MRARGLSDTDIAERSGLSRGTVWRLANGAAHEPVLSSYLATPDVSSTPPASRRRRECRHRPLDKKRRWRDKTAAHRLARRQSRIDAHAVVKQCSAYAPRKLCTPFFVATLATAWLTYHCRSVAIYRLGKNCTEWIRAAGIAAKPPAFSAGSSDKSGCVMARTKSHLGSPLIARSSCKSAQGLLSRYPVIWLVGMQGVEDSRVRWPFHRRCVWFA